MMEKNKTYKLEAKVEKIKEILEDLVYYGRLHPLIRKVEKLNHSNEGTQYKITERPFNWIPINVQYKALLKNNKDEIDYEITEIPFTKAFINYKLIQESENKTEVQFHLKIYSKTIGKRFLLYKMIDAQDRLMHSIQNELKAKN